jgi:hypothetical protein
MLSSKNLDPIENTEKKIQQAEDHKMEQVDYNPRTGPIEESPTFRGGFFDPVGEGIHF